MPDRPDPPAGGDRRRRLELGPSVARRRRAPGARLPRTILLGAVAVVLALIWLSRELGLDRQQLLGYAAISLLLVAGVALLGLFGAVLLALARRLLSRRR